MSSTNGAARRRARQRSTLALLREVHRLLRMGRPDTALAVLDQWEAQHHERQRGSAQPAINEARHRG